MPSKAKRKSFRKLHFDGPVPALLHGEGHARRLEADPGIEPFREPRPLAERAQHLDALPVDEAEIAGALREARFAEALEEAVEEARGVALQAGLAGTVRSLAVDHHVAFAPALDEFLDHLGRMLEVGIHDDDGAPPRMVEARGDRDLLAEIARERDRADARIGRGLAADALQRIVAAAVVDEHDLPVGGDPVEDREDAPAQQIDVAALVMDGDDEADFGRSHAGVLVFRGASRADCAASLKSIRLCRAEFVGSMAVGSTKLVLCADDFALSRGVSRGILELAETGRISATSAMTNMPEWPRLAPALRAFADRIGIGLHLNLTIGAPLGPMPSLAPHGRFPTLEDLLQRTFTGRAPAGEVLAEIERQLDAFEQAFGAPPAFVDGHQHVHVLPVVRPMLIQALQARGLQGRLWLRDPSDGVLPIIRREVSANKALIVKALAIGFRRAVAGRGLRHQRGFLGLQPVRTRHKARAGVLPGARRPRPSPGDDGSSGLRRRTSEPPRRRRGKPSA